MNTQNIQPAKELSSFIQRYEFIELNNTNSLSGGFLFLPSIVNGFLFYFYQRNPVVLNSSGYSNHRMSTGTLISSINRPVHLSQISELKAIRVIFHPGALAHMYHVSMETFSNKSIDLGKDLHPDLADLKSRLTNYDHVSTQAAILNEYFLKKIKRLDKQNYLFPILDQYLKSVNYKTTVADLANHVNTCRRNFQRQLKREVGFPPKEFIDIHKFNTMIRSINSNPKVRFTGFSYDYHFSDQSYFSRRFQLFAGIPPKAYRNLVKGKQILLPSRGSDNITSGVFLRPQGMRA